MPDDIHLFKINNVNTRAMSEMCLKSTIKTPEHVTYVVLVSFC